MAFIPDDASHHTKIVNYPIDWLAGDSRQEKPASEVKHDTGTRHDRQLVNLVPAESVSIENIVAVIHIGHTDIRFKLCVLAKGECLFNTHVQPVIGG